MQDDAELDHVDRRVLADVEKYGWHCVKLFDDDPSQFAYSIGLMHTHDHAELVIFGLKLESMHSILSNIARDIRGGRRFEEEILYDGILDGCSIAVKRVHPSWHSRYLGYAMWHRRHVGRAGDLRTVQIVWPDLSGLFPWDEKFNGSLRKLQPRMELPIPDELKVPRP